jgi:hypothetical protein
MRNLNDLYNFCLFIIRKERGSFISPAQFTANLDNGQLDAFNDYFDKYGVNQDVHDALDIFKVYQPFTSAADGSVTYPSNYLHLLAGVFTVTGSTVNKVRFVQTDEYPDVITNQLRPVSLSRPIAIDSSNGFNLYPQSQQTGAYYYMRRPATPVYGFSQVGRVITYNPTTSTQLEWLDVYLNNIIAKTLRYFGIYMNEDKVYQFAEQYNQETG